MSSLAPLPTPPRQCCFSPLPDQQDRDTGETQEQMAVQSDGDGLLRRG